jgi:hypothetical protein
MNLMGNALPARSETARDLALGADQHSSPSLAQLKWLRRGLSQPGGKLPLFDDWGQRVSEQTVRSCIAQGWAEPWFANPLKPDWLVCKLTSVGRSIAAAT